MIIFGLLVMIGVGIWQHIKEAPMRKMENYFNEVFISVGLHSNDIVPSYCSDEDVSEYASAVKFYSLVPISEWQKKKDSLEMYLNDKILDIVQDVKDNRYIWLVIESKPLPNMIEWEERYLNILDDILTIGMTYLGVMEINLEKYPHAFIAGETGSGKSNILKCLIYQALEKGYEVILIDFKRGVSFSGFKEDVPIYYDYEETVSVLSDTVEETKKRLDLFRECGVESLNDYNKVAMIPLERKIIFIDELAELLSVRDKEKSKILYNNIETLVRLSRSVGIHLIMGIQRPDSTIVTGQIKSNVAYRVCGHFADKEPSRIMLGNDKASTIPNIKGRFIVKDNHFFEVQCFYYDNALYKPRRSNLNVTDNSIAEKEKQAVNGIKTASDEAENVQQAKTSKTIDFDFSDIEKLN
ncbi:FtsK/SpoIIIE domain-containing protein [Thomasclavelia cocleata]|uniref:FtsK/SpoIIIE domain-containing protein n=1 Tax=Thomasclavelia cocleata TaxID=69824 RepID=UPI002557DC1A|nr:FtsK/SpoIIIE domain-containing protein [Thomasclavelia cocleata]